MNYLSDLKYAIRLLLKKPGFALLTTLVMATGIGLSVYLFSFLNTMMFKALPFEDGEKLVQLSSSKDGVKNNGQINLHDYLEIRNNVEGLTEFSAFNSMNLNVSGTDGARRYNGYAVESNIFKLTRTKPILGRDFVKAEDQEGSEKLTVIGYDMWMNQFGGDSNVIDKTIQVNGQSYRIIGVMPQNYTFPRDAEMWVLLQKDASKSLRGSSGNIYGVAHLNNGVSMQEVNSQLNIVMKRLEQRFPETNIGTGAYVETLQKATLGRGVVIVYSLQVVAILILLLASINVGNLLLSRAIERGKETAIRVALGAPRSRLIMQMLWESIVICSLGAVIALIVLSWGLQVTGSATAAFVDGEPPFWWDFGVDFYTIKLLFVFVFGTIIVTGLLPAWKNSGSDFNSVLRDGTRGALGKKSGRLNRFLVISEIFISVTILIAGGVMTIGTYQATFADYGADPENVLIAKVLLNESKYDSEEKKVQFYQTLQSALEKNGEVGKVSIMSALPGEFSLKPKIEVRGKEYTGEGINRFPESNYIIATPKSLQNLDIELKSGRYFNNGDKGKFKNSIIVTESFVNRHFPTESPLGKQIRIVAAGAEEKEWLTIVGVVEHTIQGLAHRASSNTPSIFRPISQAPRNQVTIAISSSSNAVNTFKVLRKTLESVDPELPAFRVEAYEELLSRNTAPLRFISSVFLLIGAAAVVLAASGIFGVMFNTINQRTQEIGVKRAIGAVEGRIIKEFLFNGLKQLIWGGVPGLLAGAAMGFGISKIMGTGSSELAFVSLLMIGIIAGVVLFSAFLPTKKALEMEPIEALRND